MANSELMAAKEELIDQVEARIKTLQQSGGINIPPNYSVSNALQGAWLILQEITTGRNDPNGERPVLTACSRPSIANSLFTMCIQGLNPIKKQCYFIPKGSKLNCWRSYFGTIAVVKRIKGVEDVLYQVIYKNDVFEFEINGSTRRITKHEQKLENIDSDNIIGAYCVVIHDGGQEYTGIMTMKQIKVSWTKTAMVKNTVQTEFPEDMALRTVINKTCKAFANTSDDSDLMLPDEDDIPGDAMPMEIKQLANTQPIDITPQDQGKPPEQSAWMDDNIPPNESVPPDNDPPEPPPQQTRRRPGF